MQKTSTKIVKVEGGKLLRLDVFFNDEKITETRITGDFFLHPEELITQFEEKTRDLEINFDVFKLDKTLTKILEDNNAELIGISTIDIVNNLKEATKNAN